MTKQETAQLLVIIATIHKTTTNDQTKLDVWHALIGNLEFSLAKKALLFVLQNSKFEPKPADILDAIKQASALNSGRPSTNDAWEEVMKKANIYKANIEWSHPHIQKAVRTIGMRNICSSECIGVERAHFIKIYDSLNERQALADNLHSVGLIDDKVKLAISSLSNKLVIGEVINGNS